MIELLHYTLPQLISLILPTAMAVFHNWRHVGTP